MMDAARLRVLAAAAEQESQGRWRFKRSEFGRQYGYVAWSSEDSGLGTGTLSTPMARYLAAVGPRHVVALLDTIAELERLCGVRSGRQ